MTKMYGIANCDTIKKAKTWLKNHNIDFEFHDYKKQPPDAAMLLQAIAEHGMEVVLNKRGTTYRKLSEEQKEAIDEHTIVPMLIEHSSMIKRPILIHGDNTIVGFNETTYKEAFNLA